MFHGPGQRLGRNTSNEDLWQQEVDQPHHAPRHDDEGDNGDGLLRIRGSDALPSMYARHVPPRSSRRGSSSGEGTGGGGTGSASPTGSPKQVSSAPSWHLPNDTTGVYRHDAALAGGSRSFRSGRNSTPLSDDGGARPYSRHSSAAQSLSSAASDGGEVQPPAAPSVYRAHFLQDRFECPLLPIEGRVNPIVLMRQGYFHIRLESDADWLSIAKLEIDGNMTRCNFRLQPHTKHTVKETRLDVGQHAVPLTFDPSDQQLEPIQSAEDVERHVGCVRILFYEAFERPGTLKWEWDVSNPAEVICLDYGSLDSFAHVYPSLQEFLPNAGVPTAGGGSRRQTHGGAGRGAAAHHPASHAVPSSASVVANQQRVAEAFERHVERSMKTKSRNAANVAINSANSSITHNGTSSSSHRPSHHLMSNKQPVQGQGGTSRSQSPQPRITQHSTTITTTTTATRQLENPLACLDRAAGRVASTSLQTAISDDRVTSGGTTNSSTADHKGHVHRHHNQQQSSRGAAYCPQCAPLAQHERSEFAAREETLKQEILFLTKRLAILEGRHHRPGAAALHVEGGSQSRSSSTGSATDRRRSTLTTTSDPPPRLRNSGGSSSHHATQQDKSSTHQYGTTLSSSPKETKASRLREGRFASHPEITIDPASSGKWRSASATGSELGGESAASPDLDSNDRILAFAHQVIASERHRLQHHHSEREEQQQRLDTTSTARTHAHGRAHHRDAASHVTSFMQEGTGLWGI